MTGEKSYVTRLGRLEGFLLQYMEAIAAIVCSMDEDKGRP